MRCTLADITGRIGRPRGGTGEGSVADDFRRVNEELEAEIRGTLLAETVVVITQ
jgi:hypothetical protein